MTLTFQGHWTSNVTVPLVPIYGFLLLVNNSIWLNSAPLWDMRLQNVTDLDFDLSRSRKVKSNGAVGTPDIWLLISVVISHMSIFRHLTVIGFWIFSPISYHWTKILARTPTRSPGWFYSKSYMVSCLGQRESSPHNWHWLLEILFEIFFPQTQTSPK